MGCSHLLHEVVGDLGHLASRHRGVGVKTGQGGTGRSQSFKEPGCLRCGGVLQVVGVQATPAGIKVETMEMKALDEDGLLALRWADADLETGECLVVRSLQETPEGVQPLPDRRRHKLPAQALPSCPGSTRTAVMVEALRNAAIVGQVSQYCAKRWTPTHMRYVANTVCHSVRRDSRRRIPAGTAK